MKTQKPASYWGNIAPCHWLLRDWLLLAVGFKT